MQETRAPEGAPFPVDQPFSYDGPNGVGGCEAGFLVHSASTSWSVSAAGLSPRIRWRVLATSPDDVKILVCSYYSPHVGMCLPERRAFWNHLRASVQHMLQRYPGSQLLLAGDANVYRSEVMDAAREQSCESQLRVVLRAFLRDFGLAILNPAHVPTHRSGSSIDLARASRSLAVKMYLFMMASHAAAPPRVAIQLSVVTTISSHLM